MADASYQPKVYREQGGDRMVVKSGGSVDVESGGEIDVESGGALKIAGTAISASAAELNIMVGVTATAAEINQAADVSSLGEVLTGTEALTVADNGKRFFLNSGTEFTTTLPALADVAAGWHCRFIVSAAASGAPYVITEATSADTDKIITNGINELAVTTGDDGPSNGGHTTVTFTSTGLSTIGDWVQFDTDGTNWFCTGQTKLAIAIALA